MKMKNEEKNFSGFDWNISLSTNLLISEECISSIVFETKEVGLKYLPTTNRAWENLKMDLGRGSIQVCAYQIPYIGTPFFYLSVVFYFLLQNKHSQLLV